MGIRDILCVRDRSRLSQSCMDAVAYLKVDVARGGPRINALVGVEFGGNGGEDALPAGIAHGCS